MPNVSNFGLRRSDCMQAVSGAIGIFSVPDRPVAKDDYEPTAISFNSQPEAYSRGATTLTSTPTADC
ncbi:hypothetical protein N9Y42_03320 [Mariniblastus sp.]|nr:hypothetical protein [Mariniblastus sp.]